ncbi:MAG TPA: hypothetical protein VJR69_07645 [Nitrospira sp.]|nr:hypothetical protein [Nitrospira sp.]
MLTCRTVVLFLGAVVAVPPAFAQTVGSELQRDVNQQNRIEQGLQSGQLNTKEASQLERGEARIDRMESNALKDGSLSQQETNKIQRAQNQESAAINRLNHNEATGNPSSASSQRMQADVQRNINQQNRIEQGVQSGQLTNKEVSHLEGGQARVARTEARAGADGHVGAAEQRRIQNKENRQSRHIFNNKHNNRQR